MDGKKSFVLYADLIHMVKKLPKDKQAELFVLILEYVNDMDPEPDDIILQIAFEPIRTQLKRDLKKWESIKEKRSEAGKMGGRPKKQDKAKKANGLFEKQKKQTEANKAVSVNDSVNVNVNAINNKKAFVADANKDLEGYKNFLRECILKKEISRDQLFMQNKVDLNQKDRLWLDFLKNSVINIPLIEDEKHAWNAFKKFIIDNQKEYSIKKNTTFKGW